MRGRSRSSACCAGRRRAGLFTPADDPAANLWFAARSRRAWRPPRGSAPVAPFYVEQEAPVPPGGLPRPGQLRPNLPNNHLQYALTWYGLAVALVGRFRRLGGPPPARRPVRHVTAARQPDAFLCRAIFRLVSAPAAVSAASRKSRYFNGLFRRGTGSLPGAAGAIIPREPEGPDRCATSPPGARPRRSASST